MKRFIRERARHLGLEAGEGGLLVRMGILVALLLCAYTIAKVLRDALFLEEFGALALPYALIAVALASAAYVWLESLLRRRFPNVGAARFNQNVAILCGLLAALALSPARRWTAGLFYLWAGAQAMILIPHFWGLALDIWDSRRARRLFPLLTGCGLIGGLAGGGFAAAAAPLLGQQGLMWVVPGLLVMARAMTGSLERHRGVSTDRPAPPSDASTWEIVRKSGYIKLLIAGIALSVVVGTLVDFQFKILIQKMYPDPDSLTQFLGVFYAGLNGVSLLFQFGAAGWLLQRLGLGVSSSLQPGVILAFTAAAMTTAGWAVVAMRWAQGIISQTLGKASTEIYNAAIRTNERRRIKAALDTLVERWSDAAVGVLLLIMLRVIHVPIEQIIIVTGALAVLWLVVAIFLDRRFGEAFRETLSRGWSETEIPAESLRLARVRRALLEGLRSENARTVAMALKLCRGARDAESARAIRACLQHPSPAARAAAVETMEAMGLPDSEGLIEGFLGESHEDLRRAAVRYQLSRGPEPIAFARRLLEGDDAPLRQFLLDALFDRPCEARSVLSWEWVDARMRSGTTEDLLLAARALGAIEGPEWGRSVRKLLENEDAGVRRAALLSAARLHRPELLDAILPLLAVHGVSHEASEALTAIGDPAVPDLQRIFEGKGSELLQSRAARVLAWIASPRAVAALIALVRSDDVRLRHIGLQGLKRVRGGTGEPVLRRSLVHRLFLRELRDYRQCLAPMASLAKSDEPEVRLLAESFQESARRALERAINALSCWYDPQPLAGMFERLRFRDPAGDAPVMEYLGHMLPRALFRTVSNLFEEQAAAVPEEGAGTDRIAEGIRLAWETGDAWLRACAVRASRYVPAFDRGIFSGDGGDPMVRAEIEALGGRHRKVPQEGPC